MTRPEWVVVLEADARVPEGVLDEVSLRRLLEALPDVRPVAMHSTERYALQIQLAAHGEAEALGLAVAHWRGALERLGVRSTRLIRAEVMTLEEFQRDCDLAYVGEALVEQDSTHLEPVKADRLGDRLLWQVFYDPLTRMPALGLFINHVERALMRSGDLGRRPGVLVLKLADAGSVVERCGRAVGDEVLVTCAQRLRAALPPHLTAARIGTDEFAVLVEGAPEDLAEHAVAVLRALADPVSVGDVWISVSARAGFAIATQSQEAEQLLGEARAAMSAAGETTTEVQSYRPGLAPARPAAPLEGVAHDPLGYLLLMQRAAMVGNESSSLPHAAGLIMSQVCAHVRWPVGHLYEVLADGSLVPGGFVHPGPHRLQGLLDFLGELSLVPGEGLAGRVAQTGRPAWVTDISSEPSLPWSRIAGGCGLNAALAFPVLLGREVVAVLEFFAPEAGPPDDTLVEVLCSVCSQLGRVVERRRSEANLRASEERLREAQALAQVGLWHFDHGGLTWSPVMGDVLGVPQHGAYPEDPFLELVHPEDRGRVHATLEALCENEPTGPLEFRIRRPDGDLRWVCTRPSVSRDDTGAVVGIHGTLLDITHLKVAEETLQERQRELNLAERVAKLGSWQLDLDTNQIEWSDGMYRLWGVDRRGFHPATDELLSRVHPDDRDWMRDAVARAAETNGFAADFRAIVPDGRQCWFRAWAGALHDDVGRPVTLVGTLQDVTKEKLAEQEIRASERHYRNIVETTAQGVWVIDAHGTTTYVNERLASMLGWCPDEMLGRPLADFLEPSARAALQERALLRRPGLSEQFETTVTRQDGTLLPVLVVASALTEDQGRYTGAVAFLSDLTGWRRA